MSVEMIWSQLTMNSLFHVSDKGVFAFGLSCDMWHPGDTFHLKHKSFYQTTDDDVVVLLNLFNGEMFVSWIKLRSAPLTLNKDFMLRLSVLCF